MYIQGSYSAWILVLHRKTTDTVAGMTSHAMLGYSWNVYPDRWTTENPSVAGTLGCFLE